MGQFFFSVDFSTLWFDGYACHFLSLDGVIIAFMTCRTSKPAANRRGFWLASIGCSRPDTCTLTLPMLANRRAGAVDWIQITVIIPRH